MSNVGNILEFISAEHNNELVSIANLKHELGFLQELDGIYQEIRSSFSINSDDDLHCMVATLYLQAHNEYYIGMSQLLKSHLGKSFISLRIAIEAVFLAYYFTKNPKNIRAYTDENSLLHKKVFRRIKDFIDKNPKDYPLARRLVKLHESCSNFSAHASFNSIAFKYKHVEKSAQKKEELQLGYFDELNLNTYLFYYFALLKTHFEVFKLFYGIFFNSELKIIILDRQRRIDEFEKKVDAKGKYYNEKRKQKTDRAV
jgi:hypothetical protein